VSLEGIHIGTVNTPSIESLVPSVQVTNGVAMWHFRVANVKPQTETTVLRQPEKLRKKLDTRDVTMGHGSPKNDLL